MFRLENKKLLFAISERGEVTHLVNKVNGKNAISTPRPFWKIIYRTTSDQEFPIFAHLQTPQLSISGGKLEVGYRGLVDGVNRRDISLDFCFELIGDELVASARVANNDELEVVELWFPHIAGITSPGGDPAQDSLYWPGSVGNRIADPLHANFVTINGYRIYEMIDHIHRDLFLPYPGPASMQWFELANQDCGLYLASYDRSLQSTCLNAQQDLKSGTLGLGFIKYPLIRKDECFETAAFVISAHAGDWHVGARKYRAWADGWWKSPLTPDWMKDFTGWLRVIMRHQYGELLRDYASLPSLYETSAAYGIDTVYILGWIPSGFCRMWPEYVPDPAMGGASGLKEAIARIHARGGRLMMFLSSYLADRETEFYKSIGHKLSIRTFWNSEVGLPETYTGEGSWRKILMGEMPLAGMCPATPEWQALLANTGQRCIEFGADGILYDLGAPVPTLCYGEGHPHAKPSLSAAERAASYQKSRAAVKQANPDAVIAMEFLVDAFSQYVDLVHPAYIGSFPHPRSFPEMYRYTFPEQILTNRECAEDETNFMTNANFTFTYGLRFDMTIFRCRGTLEDIPNYAQYLRELNRLRKTYAYLLLHGKFIDDDGVQLDNARVVAKAYQAGDELAVILWNPTDEPEIFTVEVPGYTLVKIVTVDTEGAFLHRLNSNQVAIALYCRVG